MFKWQQGRQGTGYAKMLLARCRKPVPFDLWLLRYREGSYIDWHHDPVEGKMHYRINVVLKKAKAGGEFESEDRPLFGSSRVVLFRPDQNRHRVRLIKGGTRYVLSFGWVTKAYWEV